MKILNRREKLQITFWLHEFRWKDNIYFEAFDFINFGVLRIYRHDGYYDIKIEHLEKTWLRQELLLQLG